jgi:DNA-binding NtrC family response regulator
LKVPVRRLSADAMRTLAAYDFPGNIRELRNLIERACILSVGDEITAENFPMAASSVRGDHTGATGPADLAELVPKNLDLRTFLGDLEKALIQRALTASAGAQAEAARTLGLSRSDLSYKLSKFGIRNQSQ